MLDIFAGVAVSWAISLTVGVGSADRDQSGPPIKGPAVSDKSPRQAMSKKSGKSLKEKRAAKRAKGDHPSTVEVSLHGKKH